MKTFIFLFSFLFVITGVSYAQSTVVDSHPDAAIYVIDYSTGQKVQVNYDTANLFKDAFIDLVLNTDIAERESRRRLPGEKQLVVEQLDPQTNGNSYKLELLSRDRYNNMTFTIYTFVYNADNNTLTFLNQKYQRYAPVQIDGPNLTNLNNCYSYGLFNAENQSTQTNSDYQNTADVQDTAVDMDVSADVAPPELPDYEQPECPAEGYLWQPGYWGYNPRINTYYWVPGAWVAPPNPGVVWTPPYWGYEGRTYVFHSGYWGEHVGFYGGINYGYGYGGHGFYGGEWRDNHYHYNTAVTHVNTTVVHNTYINTTVINNNTAYNTTYNNRHSFNGAGGVIAKPTQIEVVAVHERHEMPTPEQNRNQQLARSDRNQFAAPGGGKPANVAIERVPDRPVNNNQPQRGGFRGNDNARPGFNQQPNQNGGRVGFREPGSNGGMRQGVNQPSNTNRERPGSVEPANNTGATPVNTTPSNPNSGRIGVTPPANNGGTRPVITEPNNPNNPNNGRAGSAPQRDNIGTRPGFNDQTNPNGGTRPGLNEPNNPNGGRVGVTPPANTGGTAPVNNQPANPNNGRVGVSQPGGNGFNRPSFNPTNPAAPAPNNPAPSRPPGSFANPAPAATNSQPPASTPGRTNAPAGNNHQAKPPVNATPNPRNKKIKRDN